MPDGRLKRRPRFVKRPVEDAGRPSKLKSASNRLVSAERVVASRREGPCVRSVPGSDARPLDKPAPQVALRSFGSALGGESGARSNAALRVWDGPSGVLWRETREKPDSDLDYGFCGTGLRNYGRFCLLKDRADRAPAWQSTRIGHAGGTDAFQDRRRVVRAASRETRRMNDLPRWPSALFTRRRGLLLECRGTSLLSTWHCHDGSRYDWWLVSSVRARNAGALPH